MEGSRLRGLLGLLETVVRMEMMILQNFFPLFPMNLFAPFLYDRSRTNYATGIQP
jgi:hypothetical protein